MTIARPARAQAMRRYPALGFLAVAALLAVALPSALTVPNAGPPTLAEFAPVPGQGAAAGGDVGRLGSGSSGGPGFGAGEGGGPGQVPDPGQPSASLKRCVGNPPRQTEDPLSPPCVAFFEGDNFGATARGVTRDEIRVVVHWGPRPEGHPTLVDYSGPGTEEDKFGDLARAYVRYFNDRYQTYGRRVRVWGYYGDSAGSSATPADIRVHVDEIKQRVDPFVIVPMAPTWAHIVAREAAGRDILTVSNGAFDRREQQRLAPLMLSYFPDLQEQARIAATFVCGKLAGREARYSGNPTDTDRTRRFGMVYQEGAASPEHRIAKELFASEARRSCGLTAVEAAARTAGGAQGDYGLNMARMQSEGVTTVIVFAAAGGPLFWGNAAQAIGYRPEWFIPGRSAQGSGLDDNFNGRTFPVAQWSNAFGISYDRRRGATEQQPWFLAFREGCPACEEPQNPDVRARGPQFYEAGILLHWAIQAAGPRLTTRNIDRGLHAIPRRPSPSPDHPAVYFGDGDYSFVKDGMMIWWDGAGPEPGTGDVGCYRLPHGGRRHRAGEWPAGDDDVRAAGPCQGSAR